MLEFDAYRIAQGEISRLIAEISGILNPAI
jgi:hypothetical protein